METKCTEHYIHRERLWTLFSAFWASDEGQDLVEYALLLSFIALAVVAAVTSFGQTSSSVWSKVNSGVTSAATQAGS